jgi:hypothetical protein
MVVCTVCVCTVCVCTVRVCTVRVCTVLVQEYEELAATVSLARSHAVFAAGGATSAPRVPVHTESSSVRTSVDALGGGMEHDVPPGMGRGPPSVPSPQRVAVTPARGPASSPRLGRRRRGEDLAGVLLPQPATPHWLWDSIPCSVAMRSGKWMAPLDMITNRVPSRKLLLLAVGLVLALSGLVSVASTSLVFPAALRGQTGASWLSHHEWWD